MQAAVIHKFAAHRLLLQVPGRYFALDTTRGLLSSRSGRPTWTFVCRGGGACALRSTCQLLPIACDDVRPLGPARQERDGRERFGERDGAGPIGTWRSLTAGNQRIRSDCPCWVPTRYPRAPAVAIPTSASWIAISSRSGAERQNLLRFSRQRGQRECLGRDRCRCGALPPRAPAVLVATILSSWIAVPGLVADQTKWLVHV